MNGRLRNLWEKIRTSYWFVPSLMVAASAGASVFTVWLDNQVGDEWIRKTGWFFLGSPDGARSLLSTVAGSMITVAGVAFSITIVALTLASSQFGPRLLRNFMRDAGNQIVLGTFLATFLYCLLVLRMVRGTEEHEFVPHISVTTAVVLAITSLGVLIYFIHHVSQSMQADVVISDVGKELRAEIDRLMPDNSSPEPVQQPPIPDDFDRQSRDVHADSSGYLQTMDTDKLEELAVKHDLVLRLQCRGGRFVTEGDRVAQAYPARHVEAKLLDEINATFTLGSRRTPTDDVEYAINQLVEIALRALSPGINDPFTAIVCIDWLGVALSRLAGRRFPPAIRRDDAGRVRLILSTSTFAGITDACFNQIRQNMGDSVAVALRLLEVIATVKQRASDPAHANALHHHADMIQHAALEVVKESRDRQDIEERYKRVIRQAPLDSRTPG